jgi:hypothetical protein
MAPVFDGEQDRRVDRVACMACSFSESRNEYARDGSRACFKLLFLVYPARDLRLHIRPTLFSRQVNRLCTRFPQTVGLDGMHREWCRVRGQVSGVRCQGSGARGQGSGARCQVSGVRGQGSGVGGRGSGVRGRGASDHRDVAMRRGDGVPRRNHRFKDAW